MKPDAQPGHPVPGMSIWGWNDYVRFEAKFERRGPDECWLWTAHISAAGYGKFWLGGRKRSAHAAAWLLYRGRIPDGFVVDHVAARGCTNLHCVNPSHLEPVTQRENVLRGKSPAAARARQTHCLRGHEYTPENTGHHHGCRRCLRCHREDEIARYRSRKERVSA